MSSKLVDLLEPGRGARLLVRAVSDPVNTIGLSLRLMSIPNEAVTDHFINIGPSLSRRSKLGRLSRI